MSIVPASEIPVSMNYTNRDFYSLRQELIARVQNRIPTWVGTDPADFGIALIEAFAYMGDVMSYYIDRNANESFIKSATQRSSVLAIAKTYGYVPAGYRQAETSLEFKNSSENNVTLPAGTIISGDVTIGDVVETVYFTTVADAVSVKATSNGDVTVVGFHGQPITFIDTSATVNAYGELLGTSLETPNMIFELTETPVVDGSVEVYVEDGMAYSKWREVAHIIDYGPYDQVFTTSIDENGVVSIIFGDGISGQIPTYGQEIRALYTIGGGEIGNIAVNTLNNIVYVPGLTRPQTIALQGYITVSNATAGIGGSDPESTEQIRNAAPASLTANSRAITLKDFGNLALGVSGVGIATAIADTWSSVTLYIAPSRTSSSSDPAPGLNEIEGEGSTATNEYLNLKDKVESQLADKVLLGTSLTVQPPTYVDVVLTVQYTKKPQYTTAEVEYALKKMILDVFGYVYRTFKEEITVQDVEYFLQQVPGVKAKLTSMHRQGDTGLNTLTGTNGEIFRFKEENLNIGPA